LADAGQENTVAATAEYVQGMAKELRVMAAKVDLGFLAYLLSWSSRKPSGRQRPTIFCGGGRPGG
jgi:hypothetical protein